MKKILLIFSLIIGVFLYTVGIMRLGMYIKDIDAKAVPNSSVSQKAEKYIVKEYNGEVWVFTADSNKPERKLNIKFDTLRKVDRELLQKGISADNLKGVQQIEEDFSS